MSDSGDPTLRAIEDWPPLAAQALRDLHALEEPARLRLWAACDLVEMLARLMVVLGIAELAVTAPGRRLPSELLGELAGRIEEPTLGAWHAMAVLVAHHVAERQAQHFPELPPLVERLGRLLTGGIARADRNEENALITVRNAFAHGGGVSETRAAALLKRWQPELDGLVSAATWLGEVELLVRRPNGGVARATGSDCSLRPIQASTEMPATAGAAAIRRAGKILPLEPLVIFDVPCLNPDEEPLDSEPAVQAYARKGPVRLLLTPFGSEAMLQSVGSEALTQAFQELFDFSATERAARERRFVVPGFESDIRTEAARVIGRAEESDQLLEAATGTRDGAMWISGPAGIGKSALMARLALQLLDQARGRESRPDQQKLLILPYRFRGGEARCRSDQFIAYLMERLEAWDGLPLETAQEKQERKGRDELQQLNMLLARIGFHRLIVLVDGLDEIDRIDAGLVDKVLPRIRGAGVLLICAGRPEPRLRALREQLQALEPLGGEVRMMKDSDIRAQLLARIDRASRRLIRQDRDWADGSVRNVFIQQVTDNAKGLPLYVEHVANDIIALRLRVLDALEARQLPKGLNAYFETLIDRHSLDDSSVIRALAAAVLTLAREPLSAEALAALLRRQGYTIDADTGDVQVETSLASLGAMLLAAETPERTRGYRLYHDALREHLEASPRFANTLATMLRVFLEGALRPAGDAAAPYLYRNGIAHLIAAGSAEKARGLLSDFDYLMNRLTTLAKVDPLPAIGITADWSAVVKVAGRGDGDARRAEAFWRERAHLFHRGSSDWPSYKILLQVAVEHGDDSTMSCKADAWIAAGRCDWPWLRRLSRPVRAERRSGLRSLEAERDQTVTGALLLPDARILSWWSDHTLRCFDSTTGAPGLVLSGHTDWVWGAQATSDRRLLSWSSDGTLRLWDIVTGQPGPVLSGHGAAVSGALVTSNGRILSWSDDGTLRLWDATTGEPGPVMTGHAGGVSGALLVPDGRILSWSKDKTLRLWDGLTGEPGPVLSGHKDGVEGALVLADGRILSWTGRAGKKASGEARLRLWDGITGKAGLALSPHVGTVFGALVMPDGRILSWSRDRTLRLWEAVSGAPATTSSKKRGHGVRALRSLVREFFGAPGPVLSGHTAGVFGALVTPDGRILSWSWDTTLRLWDGRTGEAGPVLEGHTDVITGASVMPDGRILSWSADRTLRLWDGLTGEPGPVLSGHNYEVTGALAMTDGQILSWCGDLYLRLWDPEAEQPGPPRRQDVQISELQDERKTELVQTTNRLEDEWGAPLDKPGFLHEVFVLPDGRFALSQRHSLELYHGASEKPDLVLTGHTGAVRGILAVPGGRLLSWSYDETLRLWDGTTGAPGPVLRGHTDSVLGAFLMPGGRILSWSADKTLRSWDGMTGTPGPEIFSPAGIHGALPTPDGRVLSWSKDYTLHLRNGETLRPGPVLRSQGDIIDGGVLALPNGRILRWLSRLIVGGDEMRLWSRPYVDKGLLLPVRDVDHALAMPDGRILSWCWMSEDRALRLWDRESGAAGPVLQGHTDGVVGALAVPDGRILSWSDDGTLRLWDGETGAPGPVLSGSTYRIVDTFVMPDGRLLSLSSDGTVRLWRLPGSNESLHHLQISPEVVIGWQGDENWSGEGRTTASGLVACTSFPTPVFLHRGAARIAFTDLP